MLSSISHLRVSTPAAAGCGHETNYRIFGFILGDFVLLIQVNLQHRDDWYVQHVAQVPFLHVWTWDTGERPQVCLSLLYRLYISVWQLRGQTNTQDVNWNCALCCCLLKQFSFSRRARGVSVSHLRYSDHNKRIEIRSPETDYCELWFLLSAHSSCMKTCLLWLAARSWPRLDLSTFRLSWLDWTSSPNTIADLTNALVTQWEQIPTAAFLNLAVSRPRGADVLQRRVRARGSAGTCLTLTQRCDVHLSTHCQRALVPPPSVCVTVDVEDV